MPNKKPPAPPTSPGKTNTRPAPLGHNQSNAPTNPRVQIATRWQRSKRYGWDSR